MTRVAYLLDFRDDVWSVYRMGVLVFSSPIYDRAKELMDAMAMSDAKLDCQQVEMHIRLKGDGGFVSIELNSDGLFTF